jgi:hypothetical protein
VSDQVEVALRVVQGDDDVGQIVVGGAQEDGAFERFVKQRAQGPWRGLTD